MKWVIRIGGTLVGLLVLGTVVLFAMGQRAGANRSHASLEINAPPDKVWQWVSEPDKLKQWVGWVVEIRNEPSKQVWVMRDENNRGALMEIHSAVQESAPPRKLRVSLSSPGAFEGVQTYELTDLGGRTKLDITMTYELSHWFARLMEPLVTPAAEKKMAADSARLKGLVEAGQ